MPGGLREAEVGIQEQQIPPEEPKGTKTDLFSPGHRYPRTNIQFRKHVIFHGFSHQQGHKTTCCSELKSDVQCGGLRDPHTRVLPGNTNQEAVLSRLAFEALQKRKSQH